MSLQFPCSRYIWPEASVHRTEMAKHRPKITEVKNLKNAPIARCASRNVSQGLEFPSIHRGRGNAIWLLVMDTQFFLTCVFSLHQVASRPWFSGAVRSSVMAALCPSWTIGVITIAITTIVPSFFQFFPILLCPIIFAESESQEPLPGF